MKILPINRHTYNHNINFKNIEEGKTNLYRFSQSPYERELEALDREIHNRINLIHSYYPKNSAAKEKAFNRLFREADRRTIELKNKYFPPEKNWFQKLFRL